MNSYADPTPVERNQKRVRLAIAHNNHDLLYDLEVGLQQSGFSVFSADTGIACVAQLELYTPDLLLLDADLKWGGYDGVLAVVEANQKLCKTRVIVLASEREHPKFLAVHNLTVCDILFLPLPIATISERCIELSEANPDANDMKSFHAKTRRELKR